MKTNCLVISLIFFYISSQAQEPVRHFSGHQLGIHAGLTTGVGFSYRYWPGKLGIQVTCIPIKTEDDWKDIMDIQGIYSDNFEIRNKQFISSALTGLYEIKGNDYFKVFGYWGNHVIFEKYDTQYNTGLGIGFSIETVVSFNIMAGYGGYDIFGSLDLYPTFEMGIYYQFYKK